MYLLFKRDRNLSHSMISSWVNMAVDGVPNIDNDVEGVHIKWEQFMAEKDKNMVMHLQSGQQGIHNGDKAHYRKNVCDFWFDEVGQATMKEICFAN